jgi:hypothetical protein
MGLKDYNSRTNRIINPTIQSEFNDEKRKKREAAQEKQRAAGNVSYYPPLNKKQKAEKASYKLKADKYNLGPLDKIVILQYDKPAKSGSKRQTSKGPYTLNSFITWGKYKGKLIADIYVNDLNYLKYMAKEKPKAFSIELLNILK